MFVLGLILLLLSSCAPKPGVRTSVSISLPTSNKSVRSIKRGLAPKNTPGYTINDLTSLDDIDCYVVLLQFDGSATSGNCIGDTLEEEIRIVSDTVREGGELTIFDVPTERDINFKVMGFSYSGGICPDYRTLSQTQIESMSRPMIVGSTIQSLKPVEENIVSVDISMSTSQAINGCSSGPFAWAAGGVFGAAKFGQARFGP